MYRWPLLAALAALPLFAAEQKKEAEEFFSPAKSVARMKLPDGFRASLVAAEPTFVKPIAMTTDERGRVWVVESLCYPHWLTDDSKPGKDRVLIFEPDGKGGYSHKVFLENGRNLSGIALGFGGVYLCSVPKLVFIPIKDDKPAGKEVVLLDGWNIKTKHNVVNGLDWGPDGYLYGLNGIQSTSRVGAPGTPDDKRVSLDCGVWRYHPVHKTFEAVAHGTTNPWGLDWDDHGEIFVTNCVIKHVFHFVPGGHYARMYGQDVNPHTYGLIESCADHIHWGGGDWTSSRGGKGKHDAAGGGHAHSGALFYLGDTWPKEYRNRVMMCNIHGNRVNVDRLERSGSGYVVKHCDDFLHADDPWFRGLTLKLAPDGGVYVSDWHDTGECHNYDKTHPSGRIYKIDFGKPKEVKPAFDQMTDAELVALQLHKNDWWVRNARRVLQERSVAKTLSDDVAPALWKLVRQEKEQPRRLRALWSLFAIGGADESKLLSLLADEGDHVRVWAVRLLVDRKSASKGAVEKLTALAKSEKSAMVRLALASALQRLVHKDRWAIAESLAGRSEDAGDANLPLMIWYGIEAAVPNDPEKAAALVAKAKIPVVRRNLARRLAAME